MNFDCEATVEDKEDRGRNKMKVQMKIFWKAGSLATELNWMIVGSILGLLMWLGNKTPFLWTYFHGNEDSPGGLVDRTP